MIAYSSCLHMCNIEHHYMHNLKIIPIGVAVGWTETAVLELATADGVAVIIGAVIIDAGKQNYYNDSQ